MNVQAMEQAILAVLEIEIDHHYNETTMDRKTRGFFGAPCVVIEDLWHRMQPLDDPAGQRIHLLWALVFLKVYSTEDVHCRLVGIKDPKTFRKWSWYMLSKIAGLKGSVIDFDKRFDGWDGHSNCLISVDGTDCPVNEPWPFDGKWYSKKFNGPAVKYEVGVCIQTGWIVWVNGPFLASTNDNTIFQQTLAGMLSSDEGVEVDSGYGGHDALKTPTVAMSSLERKMKSVVRGRHENVNGLLKVFNVLNVPFHHSNPRPKMMGKHGMCFDSIAVITQLKLMRFGPNYDVQYDLLYE